MRRKTEAAYRQGWNSHVASKAFSPPVVQPSQSIPDTSAATAQAIVNFNQLPKEVRDLAVAVRNQCKDLDPEKTFTDMQGILILSLNGDSSRDIIVDNKDLCGGQMPGANCSNRACTVTIYKEVSKGKWRKIFSEDLYDKFLAIDWDTMRFQLMVASIYAGDLKWTPIMRQPEPSSKV